MSIPSTSGAPNAPTNEARALSAAAAAAVVAVAEPTGLLSNVRVTIVDPANERMMPTDHRLPEDNIRFCERHKDGIRNTKIILGVILLAGLLGTGMWQAATQPASQAWFHANAQGLIVGTVALAIGIGVIMYCKVHNVKEESTASKMRYAALFGFILLAALTFVATCGGISKFDASNKFVLQGLKQWQGWIGPAGILFVSGMLLAKYLKLEDRSRSLSLDLSGQQNDIPVDRSSGGYVARSDGRPSGSAAVLV
jgi:hypothetical protein